MRSKRMFLVFAVSLTTLGCNSGSGTPQPFRSSERLAPEVSRSYNGSASVGDFLTITVDESSQTITYSDLSNGEAGTLAYTTNSDGTYKLSDPSGNLVEAYEVPNQFLLVQAKRTGEGHNALALVTAMPNVPISLPSKAGKVFNFLHFETSNGGFEVGSMSIDSQGNISESSYWPFGNYYTSIPFHRGEFPVTTITQGASGSFLEVTDTAGGLSYVFGPDGTLVVDGPDGTNLGFAQAAQKEFDPVYFGTYRTSVFQSKNTNPTGAGTESFDNGSLTLDAKGHIIITDSRSQVIAQGTLQPVADVPYLYNDPEYNVLTLQDPCFGLFTFRLSMPTSQQDVFVGFGKNAVIFASFTSVLPQNSSATYNYFYGVALRNEESRTSGGR